MAHSTAARADAYNNMPDGDMTTVIGNGRATIDLTGRSAMGGDFMPSARIMGTEFVGEDFVGHDQHAPPMPPMPTPGEMVQRQQQQQDKSCGKCGGTGYAQAMIPGLPPVPCDACNSKTCRKCGGSRFIQVKIPGAPPVPCDACDPKTGELPCGKCGGRGYIELQSRPVQYRPCDACSPTVSSDTKTAWKAARLSQLPGALVLAGHPAIQALLEQQFSASQQLAGVVNDGGAMEGRLAEQQVAQLRAAVGQLQQQQQQHQQQRRLAPGPASVSGPVSGSVSGPTASGLGASSSLKSDDEGKSMSWWIPVLIAALFAAAILGYAMHKGWLSLGRLSTPSSSVAATTKELAGGSTHASTPLYYRSPGVQRMGVPRPSY